MAILLGKAQAQCVVVHQQGLQRLLQRIGLQRLAWLEQHRLVPVVTLGDRGVEEHLMDRQQGQLTADRALIDARAVLAETGDTGQTLHGLVLKQLFRREADPRLPCAANDLDGDDRVTAKLEKVIRQADLLKLEHVLPDRRDTLLQLALRCHVGLLQLAGIRGRQGLAVELAVGGQRQAVEEQNVRRDHVVRQCCLEPAAQFFAQRSLLLGRHRHFRHHVTHQLRTGRTIQRQHQGVAHRRLLLQTRLDFTQLDPETADLHLMVDAADVLDHSIGTVTRQVAGTVQPRTGLTERVGDETCGGEVGTLQITTRQTGLADIQLTDATLGYWIEFSIQQVPGQVGNRLTDRAAGFQFQIGQRQRPVGHVHCGFGDAIHVDQLRGLIAETLKPRTQAFYVQRFATEHHITQRRFALGLGTGHLHQRLERRRGLVQHRDAFVAQQGVEIFR
ncbi:hypothetical protein D3C79_684010 [compost metagenome]